MEIGTIYDVSIFQMVIKATKATIIIKEKRSELSSLFTEITNLIVKEKK